MNAKILNNLPKDADYFFKPVPELKAKALDYDKLDSTGFPISVVLCERMYRMKTFGGKKHIYKKWLEHGKNHIEMLFLRNLADDIDLEKGSFLNDIPVEMNELEYKPVAKSSYITDKEGNKFAKMSAVGTPRSLRGSREYCHRILWDEFNDSFKYLGDEMMENFWNILSSSGKTLKPGEKNSRRCYILGNNRTLNHPFFLDQGIAAIEDEVTYIFDLNGNPYIQLIVPKLSAEEIKNIELRHENDWEFQGAKISGAADHMYFNQSQTDDINFLWKYFDLNFEKYLKSSLSPSRPFTELWLSGTYRVGNSYLNIYNIPPKMANNLIKKRTGNESTRFHVVNMTMFKNDCKINKIEINLDDWLSHDKNGNLLVYVSNPVDQKNGEYLLENANLKEMRKLLAENQISFENVSSKQKFYNLIKKQKN